MLFISPPFGTYFHLPYTQSIKGSFTIQSRPGLFKQIISTLYYSKENSGWVNKIGLRNPGIDFAIHKYNKSIFPFYRNSIISIAILEEKDIELFLEKIPKEMSLEINVSCPNTEEQLIQKKLSGFLNDKRKWCSIKVSPNTTLNEIGAFYDQGFRIFHCCNTIPIKNGGLSGPSIIPKASALIIEIKEKYDDVEIIAGGGIQNIDVYKSYKKIGATHFSVSSLLFHPFKFMKFYWDYCHQE